jgi:hypothetical protein
MRLGSARMRLRRADGGTDIFTRDGANYFCFLGTRDGANYFCFLGRSGALRHGFHSNAVLGLLHACWNRFVLPRSRSNEVASADDGTYLFYE